MMASRKRQTISVDAIVYRALDKRTIYPVESTVYIRNERSYEAEACIVLGVFLAMTSTRQFAIHYLVAPPLALAGPTRAINTRVVNSAFVYGSFTDIMDDSRGKRFDAQLPPSSNSIEFDIREAVMQHRREYLDAKGFAKVLP
jgi:hypothetical protein